MGYGTKILDRICELADEHFVALEIAIQPDGSAPHMDVAALTAMYERRGFEVVEKSFSHEDTDGPRMSRSPQPVKTIGLTV